MSREGFQPLAEPVSGAEFRRACGRFPTGVAVATVAGASGEPHGLTVSSFTSVSLEPPLILICLGYAATEIEEFCRARYFGLCFLSEDQRALSEHFARKGHHRFGSVAWNPGATGVPLVVGALATFECAVHQRVPSGDHEILVGEVLRTQVYEGSPLVHYAGRYRKLAEEIPELSKG
jgi:flavin reductase (DIM6/NTAB) family NADH-FMN oxidoreductase RutF